MAISDLLLTVLVGLYQCYVLPMEDDLCNSEFRPEFTPSTVRGQLVLDHSAYLKQHLETQGLSQKVTELIMEGQHQ